MYGLGLKVHPGSGLRVEGLKVLECKLEGGLGFIKG